MASLSHIQVLALSLFLFAISFVIMKIVLNKINQKIETITKFEFFGYWFVFMGFALIFITSGVIFFYSLLLN